MLQSLTIPSKSKLQSLKDKALYTAGFVVGTSVRVAQVSSAVIKHDTKIYLNNIKSM